MIDRKKDRRKWIDFNSKIETKLTYLPYCIVYLVDGKFQFFINLIMTTTTTKSSALESFSKHGKIGSKSDQQSTFRGLLDSYNGDYLSLFRDAKQESLIDMIQIINHIDELSMHFLSVGNILEVLTFLVSLKKDKVTTDMLELLRHGIKDFSSTSLNDYIFTVALSSIPSQDIALSEVSCVLVEHFLVANTTYLTQFHTHSVPYLDRDTTIFLRCAAVVSKVLSKSDILFQKTLETGIRKLEF